MYILALETTGRYPSVGVINSHGQIFEKTGTQSLNHLQNLMPMTGELLEEIGITLDDINVIAASEGPGSFTGIRIGVSSARALAQVTGKPTIGVKTLKAFAYQAEDYSGLICPVFDARRSQVYSGAYEWNQGKIIEVVEGKAYKLEELLKTLEKTGREKIMFFGDGIKVYEEAIGQWNKASNIEAEFAEEENRLQRGSSAAKLALEEYKKGNTLTYEELKPNYMRKAEAERKLEEKARGEANV
ncbi:MAG: tRNA (adenosine(37)-N6)-threonylcarbamoyltransferase complex dimerization subunit type 1 TsaB [Anaerovoracaceae bacterium]